MHILAFAHEPAQGETAMTKAPEPKFTDLQMEAALCAWEYMLEQRDSAALAPLFEGHGTAGMRMVAIGAGEAAMAVYDHMEALGLEFTEAYDYTFVPSVLERLNWTKLVNHRLYAGEPYTPELTSILDQIRTENPSAFYSDDPKEAWLRRATAEAQRLWAYPGLISENPEMADHAFQQGDNPEAFVKALGTKLDLIPAEQWTRGH
jgi:hypothetical protein